MNILHVMGMDSTKYGGIERFNVELAKQLQDLNDKVIFIYERYPDCEQFVTDLKKYEAQLYVLNSRKKLNFVWNLIKIIRKEKIDILHAHFTKARFYAIPIGFMLGVKKLYFTIHSTMVPVEKIKLHTRLWFEFAIRISAVIAVSRNIETVCKKNWTDKIDVKTLYLGVNDIKGNKTLARESLGVNKETLMLLTVANFNDVKGLDILCQSIKLLKEQGKLINVKLYIVGQPEKDKKELFDLIKELGIENYVVQVGISNSVKDYLLAADIYLQPSRHEGLPLSLMEATAVGLPIVASSVGGIPEVISDGVNGYLVPPEKSEELAEKIELLLYSKEEREKLSVGNEQVFHLFKVNDNVAKLIDNYKL